MKDSQIVVVGAGIAGLVAAHQLNKKGLNVIVLEASSRVGGRMITDSYNGYLVDAGAQFLSSAYPILSEIVEELGIKSEYVETSRSTGMVRNGKIYKFRYGQPLSLLFGGLLNFTELFALGMGSYKLQQKTKKIPINNYTEWIEFDDETTDLWSNRYYGNTITDYFIEPLLGAFYFQSPNETSKALTIAVISLGVHKAKTMTLVNGIGSLPELLAKNIDVRLNSPVTSVETKSDGVSIHTTNHRLEAERVILATPAHVSKCLYRPSDELENELLDTKYSSTVNIAFALEDKLSMDLGLEDIYGVWIPRLERKIISAFTIETHKEIGRTVSGELVNVMLSGEAGHMMVEQEEDCIISMVLEEMERYLPGISDNIVFTKVYRWVNAEPLSRVGRSRLVHEYRNAITKRSKVILAGDYLGMPFTEGAAETGYWAACIIDKS